LDNAPTRPLVDKYTSYTTFLDVQNIFGKKKIVPFKTAKILFKCPHWQR
jgi:hypothetical protein